MTKVGSRNVKAARRVSQRRRDPLFLLLFIVICSLIVVVITLQHKNYIRSLRAYTSYTKQLLAKISWHRTSANNVVKPKMVANHQESEIPEIHFEFYNTLPNATVSSPATTTPTTITPPVSTSAAKLALSKSVNSLKLTEKKVTPSKPGGKSKLVSEAKLQKDVERLFLTRE